MMLSNILEVYVQITSERKKNISRKKLNRR